ncbi:MAG: MBL fold metallo-hydrolase [Planctomycetales bacterium]|nr:MBL fold metallo-hydrolase [Planctomycetales bacterium]
MKLYFLGANRQVTGSRYVLDVAGKQIMIDCGLFQERPYVDRNWAPCPVGAANIDVMLLTHAHIDHSGLIPRFFKEGYRGKIITTAPTVALADVMLRDSAQIQAEDAEYKRKRHAREGRRGKYPEEALYTEQDAADAIKLLEGVGYNQQIQVTDAVTAVFHDAGHILGSAMIELLVKENGKQTRIVFSGDVGQWNKPIIGDPSLLDRADYIIMESTYGDRLHEQGGEIGSQLETIVKETRLRGGNLVIPTFATERAQELMYHFGKLVHAGRLQPTKIFLDSPMALDISAVFLKFQSYFDEEMTRMLKSSTPPLQFPGLTYCRTADQSKAINFVKEPCIIMASSGMCNAGRIKHHLRNNIERPDSTILFVGHQGDGTLGSQILRGDREVRIFNQMFRVQAKIAQIFGFSAHADKSGLLKWLTSFKQKPKTVFLTHGEEAVALNLADHIDKVVGWPVHVPRYREVVELG